MWCLRGREGQLVMELALHACSSAVSVVYSLSSPCPFYKVCQSGCTVYSEKADEISSILKRLGKNLVLIRHSPPIQGHYTADHPIVADRILAR